MAEETKSNSLWEKRKTYTITAVCGNCGDKKTVTLLKGVTIKKALAGASCDNCGCFQMHEQFKF